MNNLALAIKEGPKRRSLNPDDYTVDHHGSVRRTFTKSLSKRERAKDKRKVKLAMFRKLTGFNLRDTDLNVKSVITGTLPPHEVRTIMLGRQYLSATMRKIRKSYHKAAVSA